MGRTARRALLGALVLLTACEGGPTNPGGRGGSAQLALAITLQAEAGGGGEGDAYDAANAIHISLTGSGGAGLLDQTAPFEPAAETRVPIAVMIEQETTARLQVTLLRGASPLFEGTTSLTLVPNDVASANLELVPVAASIDVPETLPTLRSQGETATLPGSVLFATGDVATSLHLQWVSLTPDIVSVQTDGSTSSLVALRSGLGRLKAAFPPFESDVQVEVDIVAATVDVEPATAELPLGETLLLTATPRDALGNPVAGAVVTWSSLDEDVASVTGEGVVRGLAHGTATIRASVGEVIGEATIEVVAPPPSAGTDPATGVGVFSATLRATVSAKGSPATAWFRYGTDPTLEAAEETPHTDIGSGEEERSLSADIDGLDPATDYYFRVVASNDGGQAEGDIATFTTLPEAPPVVETLEPAEVGSTEATLAATVDPRGAATTAWFEWGVDFELNTFAETEHVSLGAGVGPEDLRERVTDLTPEGTLFYYYRVVAENPTGVTRGSIVAFKTTPTRPTGLGGSFDGYTLFMNWNDNSTSETSFQIELGTGGPTGTFEKVGSVAGSSAPYAFWSTDGPFPAATVYYRVRACNGSLCSEPSNVFAVSVPPPTITGYVYVCFTSGTTDCFTGYGAFTVTLLGLADPIATTSGSESGYYSFGAIPAGTYGVRVEDEVCYDFRTNQRSVTVGWGENAEVDFYADYASSCFGATEAAMGPPSPLRTGASRLPPSFEGSTSILPTPRR